MKKQKSNIEPATCISGFIPMHPISTNPKLALEELATSSYLTNQISPFTPMPLTNGPIDVNCKVIDAVMSSALESETGMGFINAKNAVEKRLTLEFLGHK